MFEKYLRPYYQIFCVNPIAKKLLEFGSIKPIYITLIGLCCGLLSSLLIAFGVVWPSLFFLLLSGYFDTLDGTFARYSGQTSDFGSAFDILSDRTIEFTTIFAFYFLHGAGAFSLLMLGSILLCITSFLVVGIFSEKEGNKSFYYSPGLIERGEAFLFFVFMIYMPSYFRILSLLFSGLVFLTAAIRMTQFYIGSARLVSGK